MKNAKKLLCLILALVCALTAMSCTASAGKYSHKHSYIAVSDESYFVTLNVSGERVRYIDFYNAYDYAKTFTLELKYNLFGKIKSAVTYQYYPDETIKSTKSTVDYDENGNLAELTVSSSEFRVFSIEQAKNEDGDTGYYFKYDGSACFVVLNEDNLAKTSEYEIGDEYLTLLTAYTYDGDGRLTKISAAAGEYLTEADFVYEDGACCFSEMVNDDEDGYSFVFKRDEDHNVVECTFVSKLRSFSTEFKYDGRQQTVVSTTQDVD